MSEWWVALGYLGTVVAISAWMGARFLNDRMTAMVYVTVACVVLLAAALVVVGLTAW